MTTRALASVALEQNASARAQRGDQVAALRNAHSHLPAQWREPIIAAGLAGWR